MTDKRKLLLMSLVLTQLTLAIHLFAEDVVPENLITTSQRVEVAVRSDGLFSITSLEFPSFTFAGSVKTKLTRLAKEYGKDALGEFEEISFDYSLSVPRRSSIRLYRAVSSVLFTTTYLDDSPNKETFPTFSDFPRTHHFGWCNYMWERQFGHLGWLGNSSPWVFYDDENNTVILSSATNFMTAFADERAGTIILGVSPSIARLPAGFTHKTLLVFGRGINSTFDKWGLSLTTLTGKKRPDNNADVSLQAFGIWTNAGSPYYLYLSDFQNPTQGFKEALLSTVDEYRGKGVFPAYLQLDSWYYPKDDSSPDSWKNGSKGLFSFRAHSSLFPNDLFAFGQEIGLPLITHSRWVSENSPYRNQYQMSGDVAIDIGYWSEHAEYLRGSNVLVFEQDWLSNKARTNNTLGDSQSFLSNMSSAMKYRGISIMYCMPLPEHYLASSQFDNVTTIRVSNDRFDRSKWDEFLYNSRLASAVGLWPFTDALRTREVKNILLATLSAGVVGVSDELGAIHVDNLLRAVRTDGVIVKPDAPIVPADSVFISDARVYNPRVPMTDQRFGPMVAYTYTSHKNSTAVYVFAYDRQGGAGQAYFRPDSFGLSGPVYIYDWFAKTGTIWEASVDYSAIVDADGSYFVIVPYNTESSIALIGIEERFVTLGKQGVYELDVFHNGIRASIQFGSGEQSVTLRGYAETEPRVVSEQGFAQLLSHDPITRFFRIQVSPDTNGLAQVAITKNVY